MKLASHMWSRPDALVQAHSAINGQRPAACLDQIVVALA